ncbi:MAG: hypothetical protein Q8P67_05400 [archaeon]|nr:hypothetical protein [archaeon]
MGHPRSTISVGFFQSKQQKRKERKERKKKKEKRKRKEKEKENERKRKRKEKKRIRKEKEVKIDLFSFNIRFGFRLFFRSTESLHLGLDDLASIDQLLLVLDFVAPDPCLDLVSETLQLLDALFQLSFKLFSLVHAAGRRNPPEDLLKIVNAFLDLFQDPLDVSQEFSILTHLVLAFFSIQTRTDSFFSLSPINKNTNGIFPLPRRATRIRFERK